MTSTSTTPSSQDGSAPGRVGPAGLLEIDVQTDLRGPTTVRVGGEVDLSTRSRLSDALDAALGGILGARPPGAGLVVDLRRVQFIDCGGMEALAETARTARANRVDLRVLPGPALDHLVALVGGWDALVVERDAASRAAEDDRAAPPTPRRT